jgi:hypothetical protein
MTIWEKAKLIDRSTAFSLLIKPRDSTFFKAADAFSHKRQNQQ